MEKYIKSIDELKLGRRVNGGSCSDIYELEQGIYFKKFREDYCDLSEPINMEFLETIRTISEIDYLPYVIRAIDIYRSEKELFGYSMETVMADKLTDLSNDVLVEDILCGFEQLKPSVRKLSDNYVKTEDIDGDNILFNGNMYLLDLDLSLIDKRYIPDELYEETRKSLFKSVYSKITNGLFVDVVSDDDYISYINRVIDICSNYTNREIKTIGDFRCAYQKTYKKTTVC